MNIANAGQILKHFVVDNSPAIMSAMAITGVVSTTILAVKATPKASNLIFRELANRQDEIDLDIHYEGDYEVAKLTPLEVLKLTWRGYIPAAAVGLSTISLIVGAHSVHTRRNAALMTVYSLTENAFKEYKDNVIETIGEKKDQLINDNIATKRITKNPPTDSEVILDGEGQILCYESLSGRYFRSDKETIRKAQNDINKILLDNVYVSLNDFYELINLPSNILGEEIGWRSEHVLDIIFSAVLAPGGAPCLAIDYRVAPIRGYYKGF